MTPFDVDFPMSIDAISYVKAVSGGDVRVGVYVEGGADIPDGGAVAVESGAVAMNPGNNQSQLVPFAVTPLIPDTYWAWIQFSDQLANRFCRTANTHCVGDPPNSMRYDRAGGFGPGTDPCPATVISNQPPSLIIRVASVP